MLTSFQVDSFKGFSCSVDQWSRVNIISGYNNAGKTRLMDALMLFYSKTHVHSYISDRYGEQETPEKVAPYLFDPETRRFTVSGRFAFQAQETFQHTIVPEKEGDTWLVNGERDTSSQQLLPYDFYSADHLPSEQEMICYLKIAEHKGFKAKLISHLQFIEHALEDLYEDDGRLLAKIRGVSFPLSDQGGGFQRFAAIFLLLFSRMHVPFFMERAELGFHPHLLRVLTGLLLLTASAMNRQVFLTSFSEEFAGTFVDGSETDKQVRFIYLFQGRVRNMDGAKANRLKDIGSSLLS